MYCGEPGHFVSVCSKNPSAGRPVDSGPAPVLGPVSGSARIPVRIAVGMLEEEGGVQIAEYIEEAKE